MKNLAIYKNDICLIAGSGLFVNEVANYLKFSGEESFLEIGDSNTF